MERNMPVCKGCGENADVEERGLCPECEARQDEVDFQVGDDAD